MPIKVLNHAKKIDKNECGDTVIHACIVALGSNYKAQTHLQQARASLEALAVRYDWSTEFVNPDYTATPTNPKPDYTNQCGLLRLKQPCALQTLIKECKHIEQDCKRLVIDNRRLGAHCNKQNVGTKKPSQVSIDIDVLAVRVNDDWLVICQRHPFKAHERIGIKQLQSLTCDSLLNNI